MYSFPAHLDDAPRMGQFMVETWLEAHRGQVPDDQWLRRREQWTPELSAAGWANTLREMADGTRTRTCIYLACDPAGIDIHGLVMGVPARHGPWEDAAQIAALYVHQSRRREGLGRGLLQIAVDDLIGRRFERLIIGCLDTNTPGLRFYEHLGGVVVGYVEDEEYGFSSTQVLFGWPDISTLAT